MQIWLLGFLAFWVLGFWGVLATVMVRAVTCTWDKFLGREGKEEWKRSGLNGTRDGVRGSSGTSRALA